MSGWNNDKVDSGMVTASSLGNIDQEKEKSKRLEPANP
jgi:hypothetical protein